MNNGIVSVLIFGIERARVLGVLEADGLRRSRAEIGLVLRLERREHLDTIAFLDGDGRSLLLHEYLEVLRRNNLAEANDLIELELDALAAAEQEVLELAADLDRDPLAVEEVERGALIDFTLVELNDFLHVLVVAELDGPALLDLRRLLDCGLRFSSSAGGLGGRSSLNRSRCLRNDLGRTSTSHRDDGVALNAIHGALKERLQIFHVTLPLEASGEVALEELRKVLLHNAQRTVPLLILNREIDQLLALEVHAAGKLTQVFEELLLLRRELEPAEQAGRILDGSQMRADLSIFLAEVKDNLLGARGQSGECIEIGRLGASAHALEDAQLLLEQFEVGLDGIREHSIFHGLGLLDQVRRVLETLALEQHVEILLGGRG